VDKAEKKKYEYCEKIENGSFLKGIQTIDQIITDMKKINTGFANDLTLKHVLVDELQDMVSQSKFGEEQQEQPNDIDDEEQSEMSVISQTTLQLYAQSWKLQPHLDQLAKPFLRLQSVTVNETLQ
jgi:hypothetical protein